MIGFGLLIGSFALFLFIAAIAAILSFVFWIWMLIGCLKRNFKNDNDKILWALVIIFLHVLGAAIYYFVIRIDDKDTKKQKKK